MARPRLSTDPYLALSVRLDPATVADLDRYVEDLRREMVGARVDRGTALRRLVLLGLHQQLGDHQAPTVQPAPDPSPTKPPAARVPAFDAKTYYLGALCPRGHSYYSTGQSLRRMHNRSCAECERLSKRERRWRLAAQ
jgi:hypothetical protein